MKFLQRFRGLANQAHRQEQIERAIDEARAALTNGQRDIAREPVLQLLDKLKDAGIDYRELLEAAERSLPEDTYWLRALAELILIRPELDHDDVAIVLRYARQAPDELNLWSRLVREAKRLNNLKLLANIQEECALALGPYFPDWETSKWSAKGLEEEALRLFYSALSKAADRAIEEQRRDERAKFLYEAARNHFPGHSGATLALAAIIVKNDECSAKNVAVVMEALLEDPDQWPLRLWSAKCLMTIPGHHSEGLAILRQLTQEKPGDPEVEDLLISAIKGVESLEPSDLPLFQRWISTHSDDQRALEMLADYYASQEQLDQEALTIYRKAAVKSPNRSAYLRLMGRASVSRSDWSEVLENFEELASSGEAGEEILLPLASAYAAFERQDSKAIQTYKEAIRLGSKRREIHDSYCRYLYHTAKSSPESIAQFTATLEAFPDALWAKLGSIAYYQQTGDQARALDGALELLKTHPGDQEALKVAGTALAKDFSRRQLAKLSKLSPGLLRRLYEMAYAAEPEAGPLVVGLARARLMDNRKDQETATLIKEACRKHPDLHDLRYEWANILWELGQKGNACALYRDLISRFRENHKMPLNVTESKRKEMLKRVVEDGKITPSEEDLDNFIEYGLDPGTEKEEVVAIGRILAEMDAVHDKRIDVIEKAAKLQPREPVLERALAEAKASSGNPVPAIRLAIILIDQGRPGEAINSLLRSAAAAPEPQPLAPSLLDELRDACDRNDTLPQTTLLAAMELIYISRPPVEDDLTILERLHDALPANLRVRRWLARCMTSMGMDSQAAEIYQEIQGRSTNTADSELAVEMANTHMRLGIKTKEALHVAKAAIQARPKDPDLLIHLASIQLDFGHFSTAAHYFDEVLSVSPEHHSRVQVIIESQARHSTASAKLLTILAKIHLVAHRYEKALDLLGRLQPHYQYHLTEMMDLYGAIIKELPENPRPLMERGILHRLTGQFDEAIADMKAAQQIMPDNEDIKYEYVELLSFKARQVGSLEPHEAVEAAEIYLELGEEQAAMEMANMATRKGVNYDPAILIRAQVELQTGMLGECRETIKNLTDRSVGMEIYERLSRAYADRHDHLRAAEVLTDAIEYAGPRKHLLEELRNLHQRQNAATSVSSSERRLFQSLSDRAKRRYELKEELGSGAMGVVYKAYDSELDDIVVLKILPEHFAENEDALARFRHEAKAARKLAHPNIVRIHDFGEEAGRKHISMEYVSGGDLRSYIRRDGDPLSVPEALGLITQVIRALSHAHSEGVLHRDIKPANILMTPAGKVKLSDFGIAALMEVGADQPPDDPDYIFGTPLYMSPEQFRGDQLYPASDLYSVGVLLYEMLSGRPPFTKGSIAYHHQHTVPEVIQNIPENLWEIISELLAKRPEDRYSNAEELLLAIDGVR